MSELKEYVVTLKDYNDLDDFYDDMETPGGNLYIPNRIVDVAQRRPISRSTHYMLTDEEAEQVRNDPRVLSVELLPEDLGIIIKPAWIQTSSFWDKSTTTNNSNHRNWGLLRVVEGTQRPNWGDDGTSNQTATIEVKNEGRNVDVVIVDGLINPSHPEMFNSQGVTRVKQFNWYSLNPSLGLGSAGNYFYGQYTGTSAEADNNHGVHVAGTVAGITQGWARQSDIYNITPYSTDPNATSILNIMDYVRQWHKTKPINPLTGRRNPTVSNHSYGFYWNGNIASITQVYHRGVTYTTGLTSAFLNSVGIYNTGSTFQFGARYTAFEADITDAMNEGIIVIGAAMNDYMKMDVSGGVDYNNIVYWTSSGSYAAYYHRGGAPSAGNNVICVGAIGRSKDDTKAPFSNCGPRVDIYAPGRSIMSSLHSGFGYATDPRNSSFLLGKYSGTSMASPQVSGVVACLLETYPNYKQSQVLDYLIKTSKSQLKDTTPTIAVFGDSVSTYGGLELKSGQSPTVEASYAPIQTLRIDSVIQSIYTGHRIVHIARGGVTTSEAITGTNSLGQPNPFGSSGTITQWITDNSPSKIVLRYGLADAVLINNSTTTLNNLQTIIDFAVARGIEVILIGVNPTAPDGDPANCGYFPGYMTTSIHNTATAINNGIVSKAQAQGIKYANVRNLTLGSCSLPDGIHPFYNSLGIDIANSIDTQLRGQIPASQTWGNYSNTTSLQFSPNRFLTYVKERPDTGTTWPKKNVNLRPTSGRMYPRPSVTRIK